jgi:tight adherence protein B
MTLFVTLIGATLFCALQALYWYQRGRTRAKSNALLDRLGGAADLNEVSLLKEGGAGGGLVASLKTRLRQAGEPPDIGPFVAKVMLWALMGSVIGLLIGGALGTGLAGALLAGFLPLMQLSRRRAQRLFDIEKNLPEALQVLIISLKAGHALPKAITTTAVEMPGPLCEELQILADELKLGRSVEEGFLRLGQRLSSISTVRTLVVAVIVLQQTGGNLVEVLEQLVDALHEQSQYARKLAAMTAEGRMSARILCGLPPTFLILTYLVAPEYVGGLFQPGLGLIIFGIALFLYLAGFVWIRRLIDPGGT